MAFRRPVKLDGGNLRNMTDAEILLLQQEAIRQYGLAPSTTLSYSNGAGNLTTIPDYRLQAGANATGSSPWPTPGSASTITVNYNHTLQERVGAAYTYRGGTTYENFSFPVYLDGGDIKPMTWMDMQDTFFTPAKDYLITNEGTNDDLYRAGTYTIHTTNSLAGCTLVDANPIFTDTQADVTAFASGSLPEVQDQPTTVQNYYLHRFNPTAGVDFVPPVVHKIDTNDLQSMPSSVVSTLWANDMKYNVDWGTNNTPTGQTKFITYQYVTTAGAGAGSLPGTVADVRGPSMTNTYTNTQTTRYEQPGGATYYSQNVPSGTPTSYATWNLIITYVDISGNYQ